MGSYNKFLFDKRNELGLSRKQFAKKLGINSLHYYLIENGYLKPSKKLASTISDLFDIDYSLYLVKEASYPEDLPDEKPHKISKWFHHLISFKRFKIIDGILTILLLALIPIGQVIKHNVDYNSRKYYSDTYLELHDEISEKGLSTYSLTGTFLRPEIYEIDKSDPDQVTYKSIKGNYDYSKNLSNLSFSLTTWNNLYLEDSPTVEYRSTTSFVRYENDILTLVNSLVFYHAEDYIDVLFQFYSEEYVELIKSTVKDDKNYSLSIITYVEVDEYYESNQVDIVITDQKVNNVPSFEYLSRDDEIMFLIFAGFNNIDFFIENMEGLIYNKLGLAINLRKDVFIQMQGVAEKTLGLNILSIVLLSMGIILGGSCAFMFFYAVFYGKKHNETSVHRGAINVFNDKRTFKELDTDIKLTPFIPETFFEIIGIIVVAVASYRIMLYVSLFLSPGMQSFSDTQALYNSMTSVLYFGMFLLYFIDFDIFLEDRRVIRNIFMYLILFLCLYGLEIRLEYYLLDTENIIMTSLTKFKLPNMFFSIACYFIIMFFLFYTPKFINSKKKIIVFRSISIIPTIIVIANTIISTCANTYWGWDMPIEVSYLFSSEKIGFSMLCILYLYSYFFLRLHYERKLGTENARKYFNGNKFLWQKNVLVGIVILVVVLFDVIFSGNKVAETIGISNNLGLLTLIPVILFYHPHKGERNFYFDTIINILYFIAIGYVWFFAAVRIIFFL